MKVSVSVDLRTNIGYGFNAVAGVDENFGHSAFKCAQVAQSSAL